MRLSERNWLQSKKKILSINVSKLKDIAGKFSAGKVMHYKIIAL